MASRPPRLTDRLLPSVFAGLVLAFVIAWILFKIFQPKLPPAVPSLPNAHQAPPFVAPPKDSPVGKHVLAAIKANQKDVQTSTTTRK